MPGIPGSMGGFFPEVAESDGISRRPMGPAGPMGPEAPVAILPSEYPFY